MTDPVDQTSHRFFGATKVPTANQNAAASVMMIKMFMKAPLIERVPVFGPLCSEEANRIASLNSSLDLKNASRPRR
ncbi:hypothetical protein D3C76_1786340 [compost metagenome]